MMAYDRYAPWLVAGLLLAGLGIRLIELNQPLLSFHPTRQYRSAILARACYFDRSSAIPAWARQVADANRAMQPAGEPMIMERLACAAYAMVGREGLEIPRIFAVVFWILGVIPLYALARRMATPLSAAVGLVIYLFLPYGIVASRAFQPDPLMTSCALWATWASARHAEQPGARRLWLAALAIAAAALVKPMSVFFTVPAVVALAVGNSGGRGAFRVSTWLPIVLGLTPAVVYYGYGAVFGTLARDQMHLRFVPTLLPTAFFWGGWWRMIQRVLSTPIFIASLLGTIVASGTARSLLVAWWVGYVVFAIAFTYHMPTHDYYHLPYIALAALSVSILCSGMERSLVRRNQALIGQSLTVVIAISIAIWGSLTALPQLQTGDPAVIARYEEIGELAEHHARVLFLDTEYGYPLMYHGQISGDAWPNSDDLAAEALGGTPPIDARERYARDFADYFPSYFIVTDLRSLREQPDLQAFLAEASTSVRQEPTFHVYRLDLAGR